MIDVILVVTIVVMLGCATFFSAAEVALFSLSRQMIARWRDENDNTSRRLAKLLDRPRELVLTSLVGYSASITVVVIAAIFLTRHIFSGFGFEKQISLFFCLLVIIPLIVLFGNLIPRIVSLSNPEKIARKLSLPLLFSYFAFTPITWFFGIISGGLARIMGIERERLTMSASQLDALIEVEEQHEEINASEREMIQAVIEIRDKPTREIMVPRIDMVGISIETTLPEAIAVVRESMHSRIPVYDGTIDNIVGVLYAKDLLKEIPEDATLRNFLREPYFVPDNKHINELLKEFQKKRLHLAIVVDEYGGVAGVVTLEDILEEIIGEIQDEYDQETPSVMKVSDREWLVEGRLSVADLNETFGETVISESEDFETIGGFLNSIAGRVPNIGDSFLEGQWRFTVDKRAENRIQSVRIERESVVNEA